MEGNIAQSIAEQLLAETMKTPIVRFEYWIATVLRCPCASGCSSTLRRRYNVSVAAGEHVKPASHRGACGSWILFEEHDGAHLRRLHDKIHDERNGLQEGQRRLAFHAAGGAAE